MLKYANFGDNGDGNLKLEEFDAVFYPKVDGINLVIISIEYLTGISCFCSPGKYLIYVSCRLQIHHQMFNNVLLLAVTLAAKISVFIIFANLFN